MTADRPPEVDNPFAARLRDAALAYPETVEDFPWGERAIKVRGKVFLFMHASADGLSLSVKLANSQSLALELPFAMPTGYGLGKSGWTTAKFGPGEKPPMGTVLAWLDESYRAVAPKRVVATLAAGAPVSNPQRQKKKSTKPSAPPRAAPAKKKKKSR